MASRVGADRLGTEAVDRVAGEGVGTDVVQVDPDRPTGFVKVHLDTGSTPDFEIVRPASGAEERAAYLLGLVRERNEDVAERYRDRLIELYGEEQGRAIRYAEAFELCQYGRQPSVEELKRLFPTFD